MAKEILLYSGIHDWSVSSLIEKLDEYMGESVELRVNTQGGDLFSGWGGIAKVVEHGDVTVKVDGLAASMGFVYCLFAKSVECLDVSTFMAHRASGSNNPSEEEQNLINQKNKEIKAKMKAKFNEELFKKYTGYTIDEMFDGDEVVNVWLTAKQAEKVGLVQKVNTLSPKKSKVMADMFYKVAASTETEIEDEKSKSKNMTLAEFKEKHPAIYNQVLEEGKKLGAEAESDRVNAALVFAHLDMEGVKKIIASGKPMTATQQAEFALKAASPEALAALKKDTQGDVTTDDKGVVLTAEQKQQKEVDEFEAKIRAQAGLDKTSEKKVGNVTFVTLK